MKTKFRFCPNCKAELKEKKTAYFCLDCGMEIFKDSSPTASALILKENKVLLSTRAIEPRKGEYDLVGGFLEPGEHPDAGVIREVKEETGLTIALIDLIGVYIGNYEHQGRKTKTINFYYAAEVLEGKERPDDDVETLEWLEINNLPKKTAFKHQSQVIDDFKEWYKKNRE